MLSTTGHKPQAQHQRLLLTQIRGSSYFEDTIPIRTLQSLSLVSFLCSRPTAQQPSTTECWTGSIPPLHSSTRLETPRVETHYSCRCFNQLWFTAALASPLKRFHNPCTRKGDVTFLFSCKRHIVFPVLVLKSLLLQVRQESFPVEGTRSLFSSLVFLSKARRQKRILQNKVEQMRTAQKV